MSNFGFSVGVGGYDDENRLLNWDRNDGKLDQAWSRSAVGNWTPKTENSSNTSYTHSDAHELTVVTEPELSRSYWTRSLARGG